MSDLERVTVNLTPKASAALQKTSDLTGLRKTDVINRALQMYAFVEEILASGGKFIVEQNGNAEMIKFL